MRTSLFVLSSVLAAVTPAAAAADICDPSTSSESTDSAAPGCSLAEPMPSALTSGAGRVHFVKGAGSSFDPYTSNPSAAQQQWMRDHYLRMRTYAPYFDARLSWYPDAWVYKDLYAIYVGGSVAQQHPEWILKDASGNLLYIPYACSNGSCPQYAADIGNPAFRQFWIGEAQALAATGYRGIFVDDVNMALMVSDGNAGLVAPWDVRRGREMTVDDWRAYVADFTEAIRAALPTMEIVQNQVWFFASFRDPNVIRAIAAADYIEVERGFNDTGIRGGSGQYGFDRLLFYFTLLHYLGKGGILDVSADWGPEYALATYFLISSGLDGIGDPNGALPDDWWSAWDVDLGQPLGGPYMWNGVVRRDFSAGIVLVNEPDAPSVTVDLGSTYRGLDGQLKTQVTLDPRDGAVLLAS